MAVCTCWREYPNPNHKRANGTSKCDNYECVRPLEYKRLDGSMIDIPKRKTMCVKKENKDGSIEELP